MFYDVIILCFMHYFEQERKLHQTAVRIFITIKNALKNWSKT